MGISFAVVMPTSDLLQRRRTIVAEALIEKLEKLNVVRLTAQRELDQIMQVVHEAEIRVKQVDDEIKEVANALMDYQVDNDHHREFVHMGHSPAEHTYYAHGESRGMKEAVIDFVSRVVSVRGPVPTRELFDFLKSQKLEVSSRERLSQILSESGKFEADRTKGWSLRR